MYDVPLIPIEHGYNFEHKKNFKNLKKSKFWKQWI